MEVATGEHLVTEHERIVGRRIELGSHEPFRERESFTHRPQYLRRTAQRIRVLHPWVVVAVRFTNFAVGQQLAQQRRRALLPGVRTGVVDTGVERIG